MARPQQRVRAKTHNVLSRLAEQANEQWKVKAPLWREGGVEDILAFEEAQIIKTCCEILRQYENRNLEDRNEFWNQNRLRPWWRPQVQAMMEAVVNCKNRVKDMEEM